MQPLHFLTPCQAASAGHWVEESALSRGRELRPLEERGGGQLMSHELGRQRRTFTRSPPRQVAPGLDGISAMAARPERGGGLARVTPAASPGCRPTWLTVSGRRFLREGKEQGEGGEGGGQCTLGCLQARDDSVEIAQRSAASTRSRTWRKRHVEKNTHL